MCRSYSKKTRHFPGISLLFLLQHSGKYHNGFTETLVLISEKYFRTVIMTSLRAFETNMFFMHCSAHVYASFFLMSNEKKKFWKFSTENNTVEFIFFCLMDNVNIFDRAVVFVTCFVNPVYTNGCKAQ